MTATHHPAYRNGPQAGYRIMIGDRASASEHGSVGTVVGVCHLDDPAMVTLRWDSGRTEAKKAARLWYHPPEIEITITIPQDWAEAFETYEPNQGFPTEVIVPALLGRVAAALEHR